MTLDTNFLVLESVNKLKNIISLKAIAFIWIVCFTSIQINAQSQLMNPKNQYDLFEIDSLEKFLLTFKQSILPYRNTIDSNPLPLPFQITGMMSDSLHNFNLCSIQVSKLFVYENGNEQAIYLLIENREDFINEIINKFKVFPSSVISSNYNGDNESIGSYCFEKGNFEVWINTGKPNFSTQRINNPPYILITFLKGNFQLIRAPSS